VAEEYCKVGMWEEAVSVLEAGLKYYPGLITAMVVLGRAYDQLNQATKARAVLEGAIKLSPENLRAHRILIKIYAAQGLTQEAMTSCRVILSMNPKDEEALSVQASLGVQKLPPPRDEISSRKPSAAIREPQAAPAVKSADRAIDTSGVTDLRSAAAGDGQRTRPHAATIAQLESWLRSLERQRRDRPTSGSKP
jgi:tetratricopeptide (TPR) repeat protein